MRIVITGAAGPVGRAVVEELAADHQLCLIDKTPLAKQPSIVADLPQDTRKVIGNRGKHGDAAGAKPLKRPMASFIRCIEAECRGCHIVYGVSAQKKLLTTSRIRPNCSPGFRHKFLRITLPL